LLLSPLQIAEIFVAAGYRGRTQNHFADIAVIVTDRAFKLSRTVQPVAVDWTKAHVDKVLRPDKQTIWIRELWILLHASIPHLKSS
jgi:hypothetical protein